PVSGLERRRDLAGDLDRELRREPAAALEPLGQALARQQLHGDERRLTLLGLDQTAVVDRHDPRVRDPGGCSRLLEEAVDDLRIREVLRTEHLDRDVALETRITRQVHDAERASAELVPDLVFAD